MVSPQPWQVDMLIDQMELSEDRQTTEEGGPASQTLAIGTYPQPDPASDQHGCTEMTLARRPVYVWGRGGNKSVGTTIGAGICPNSLSPRRSVSFKFNVWRDVAREQQQAVSLLQSAFDQLTADNAAQQNSAVKVNDSLYEWPCLRFNLALAFTPSLTPPASLLQEAAVVARINQDDRKVQQDMFDSHMAKAVTAASDQQTSFDNQMAKAVMDASDQQTSFDSQMAKAVMDASDQQTSFDSQMAKAVMDASDQQTSFDSQMAKAAHAASNMKGAYDKLTRNNVRQLGGRSFVDVAVTAPAEISPDSSDTPIDSSTEAGRHSSSSAPPRRATSFLASEHGSFKHSSFSAVTDHSKLSNHHGCVTIFFSDLIGFSTWAHELPPETIMATLNDLYTRLDDIILEEMPGVYKVRLGQDLWGKCGRECGLLEWWVPP